MAHHYHIISRLDMTQFGGTDADHYFGPGMPMDMARQDASDLAKERRLKQLAGGLWSDATSNDEFNNNEIVINRYIGCRPIPGQYIMVDPCDNEMDFDIEWNAYRDEQGLFHRAPKGKPCPSIIKKEYADFFFKNN